MKLHKPRAGPGEDRVRAIVLVEGLEDDHLVARVRHREHRGDHGFGGSAADGNLAFRVDLQPLPGLHLTGDGLPQAPGAPGDGVLVHVGRDGFPGGLLDFLRGGEVGEPLGQVDRPVEHRLPGHLPDDRLGEPLRLLADYFFLRQNFIRHIPASLAQPRK